MTKLRKAPPTDVPREMEGVPVKIIPAGVRGLKQTRLAPRGKAEKPVHVWIRDEIILPTPSRMAKGDVVAETPKDMAGSKRELPKRYVARVSRRSGFDGLRLTDAQREASRRFESIYARATREAGAIDYASLSAIGSGVSDGVGYRRLKAMDDMRELMMCLSRHLEERVRMSSLLCGLANGHGLTEIAGRGRGYQASHAMVMRALDRISQRGN